MTLKSLIGHPLCCDVEKLFEFLKKYKGSKSDFQRNKFKTASE
jgi:hypothetical protein